MDTDIRPDWFHVFIDVPASSAAATRDFWARALGWPAGEPWDRHPEFVSLLPPSADAYAHVQQIDGAPRVHLDVVVADLDLARDRCAGLGAGVGPRTEGWQVMSSPGGLPFCLCLHPRSGSRPGPVAWGGGHRSRLAQVCIDIPARVHAHETAFWQQLTAWEHRAGRRPEYTRLFHRGATLELLMQRLGPDDPGTSVRAHIDLGTDDVETETRRLVGLGARHLTGIDRWIVLEDPAGLPFCVTPQSPD